MRRTWLLLGVVVLGSCTGGDGRPNATAAPTSADETTGASSSPQAQPRESSLPVLDDLEPPEWEPSTRTEELVWAMSEEELPTSQQAVDAFGLLVADFPGVTSSDLPPGESLGDSSTMRLIEAVREQLTPAQVAALDDYLDAGTLIGIVARDGSIEPASSAEDGSSSPSAREPADLRGVRASPAVPIDLDYLELLGEVQKAWTAHLPDRPAHDIELLFTPLNGGMDAGIKPDETSTCVIRVHAGFFQKNPSNDKIRFYFAHELFHCMQAAWQTGIVPPWIDEGSADWAAADLYRDRTLDFDGLNHQWFKAAGGPLAARSYSAWPFFENARLHGRNVYQLIEAMFESPQPNVTAFLGATQLNDVLFRKAWSTHTLRSSSLGVPWELSWPAPNGGYGPHENIYNLGGRGIGSYHIIGAGKYSQLQLSVQMTPDVGLVAVAPKGSPLTTHTAIGAQTVADGDTRLLCFAPDRCECPEGEASGAVPMNGPTMIFSFAASPDSAVATVRAEEWDPESRCREKPEPKKGSSNGDPHLVSFDGLPFDVITLGEFVNARDPKGDFEVQTRHQAIGFGAGSTAIALGTGEHRITFTVSDFYSADPPVVRVDGEVTSEQDMTVGDVQVTVRWPDAFVTWPDSSTVAVGWFLGWFMELTVPPERAAWMEGLLGSADGDLANDLRLADGTVVDTAEAGQPESAFALSWAVEAGTTLFDYEPGQSMSTFRIPHPNPERPEIDPAVLDRCDDALGDLAAAHEISSCAYDVSATGEEGFIEQYVSVVEARVGDVDVVTLPQPPTTTPTSNGAPAAESQAGVPTLTLSGERPAGTIDVVEGTVLLARFASCDSNAETRRAGYLDIVVSRADDEALRAVATLCDPSGLPGIATGADDEWFEGDAYVWLPGSGEYEVALQQTLGERDAIDSVEIYTDPTPTVLRSADLSGTDRRVLEGIGDTVVYLAPNTSFDAVGLDRACAVELYWGRADFPADEPWQLGVCTHSTAIVLPPDMLVPLIVFNRTTETVTVELTELIPNE